MDNQLLTLSKIFTERLFRIPDYQRGYAWTEKQLKDFWNDIQQLEPNNNHYTGVLTLEGVSGDVYRHWDDDLWIIEAKSHQPYYIVDGQQRLTTAIILIQVILERIEPGEKLNFTDRIDIQRKFIFDSKDDGISRSYLFGYEKDNPSYEFLKTKIFCERSSSAPSQETVYTQNLDYAKRFFSDRVSKMTRAEIEFLYKKTTQQLLFNIFTITEDVDVCVAFETMNNRGKPLSYLELLKNRLIYLSLKFNASEHDRRKLRKTINDCWKAIYHNLGRNKEYRLDDDVFLLTHYMIYFGQSNSEEADATEGAIYYRKLYRTDFASDLLETRFVPKNVTTDASADKRITLANVYEYVNSLQEGVEIWYKMWNPFDSDFSSEIKIWLDKIRRIDYPIYQSLILVFLRSKQSDSVKLEFLKTVERHLFVLTLLDRYFGAAAANYRNIPPEILQLAIELRDGKWGAEKVIKHIKDRADILLKNLQKEIISRFRANGFYQWDGIHYFLFEYNLDLQRGSKTDRPKIFWPEFNEERRDYVTVEHIFPRQARHEYWTSRFNKFSQKQKSALRDSLGNLLPLSKPKNSSLSNKPFLEKVDNSEGSVGYRYGCYAENEISKEVEWGPESILRRGLDMLDFMERRWDIQIGDKKQKQTMLGLDFLD